VLTVVILFVELFAGVVVVQFYFGGACSGDGDEQFAGRLAAAVILTGCEN
jgi:hypothetical protein